MKGFQHLPLTDDVYILWALSLFLSSRPMQHPPKQEAFSITWLILSTEEMKLKKDKHWAVEIYELTNEWDDMDVKSCLVVSQALLCYGFSFFQRVILKKESHCFMGWWRFMKEKWKTLRALSKKKTLFCSIRHLCHSGVASWQSWQTQLLYKYYIKCILQNSFTV